jgi:hypothetical protein
MYAATTTAAAANCMFSACRVLNTNMFTTQHARSFHSPSTCCSPKWIGCTIKRTSIRSLCLMGYTSFLFCSFSSRFFTAVLPLRMALIGGDPSVGPAERLLPPDRRSGLHRGHPSSRSLSPTQLHRLHALVEGRRLTHVFGMQAKRRDFCCCPTTFNNSPKLTRHPPSRSSPSRAEVSLPSLFASRFALRNFILLSLG